MTGARIQTPILEVSNLSVDIPTHGGVVRAVSDISFSLSKGETLCLVGESGCGKSMTAMALMDLLPSVAQRRSKRLLAAGFDLASASAQEMRKIRGDCMSMVFQEPMTALNPVFTIGGQIADVLRQHRNVGRAEARRRALDLLKKVRIPDPERRMNQYPHEQSGGQRQRILIAMALMCEPEILIADEPTTALDATVQLQLLRLMKELQDDSGMGMLFITHDLGVVAHIADNVAVMYGGRIVEFGRVSEVLVHPCHPYTKALIACLPMAGNKRRTPLPVIRGSATPIIGEAQGCAYRERCAQASDVCASDAALATRSISGTHYARCAMVDSSVLKPTAARTEIQ